MQKGNLNNSLCSIKAYLWDNDEADLLLSEMEEATNWSFACKHEC